MQNADLCIVYVADHIYQHSPVKTGTELYMSQQTVLHSSVLRHCRMADRIGIQPVQICSIKS